MPFRMRYFFSLLLLIGQNAYSQSVTAYRLLPANATANDNLRLVLTIFYGGCTRSLGYDVVRTGSALTVKGCYPPVAIAMPCGGSDTLQLGRLPAGSYTVTTLTYYKMGTAECFQGVPRAAGPPSATGSFTVAPGAGSPAGAASWQLYPTVVSATAAVLDLTEVPALHQVSICDLTGREKAHFDASALVVHNGRTQLPLPALAPALYLLRVVDTSGVTSTQRFIRQ